MNKLVNGWYTWQYVEGEESSQSEEWGEKFEDDDDIGRKGRKKKGGNVRENSPIEAEIKYLRILIFDLSSTFI